jgi:O-antigen/teichoic acid export membrane protein
MSEDARATVRNAVLVLLQRGLQSAGGLAFAVLVPRLMGSDDFGRFALATSVAFWLSVISGLGFTSVTTRYVPTFVARGDDAGLSRLLGSLLTLRVASGLAAAAVYLALGLVWWRDLDAGALLLFGLAIWSQGISGYLFALFLGMNRAGRWAMGDTLRRWLLLMFVLPGFMWTGFRGAAGAVALTELVLLAVGLSLSPLPRRRAHLWPDREFLAPYLRFGLAFLTIQVLYVAFLGSGELLVRAFSGAYAEVGFFNLAHGIYLVPAALLPQFMLAFAPPLTRLLEAGGVAELARWTQRLARVLAAAATLGVLAASCLAAPYVPLVFGAAFAPVAPNLVALALAFLALTLESVPALLTLVHERPAASVTAGIIRLALFWLLAPPLIARSGSLGAAAAVLVAVTVHGLYLVWRTRGLAGGAVAAWATPVALGLPLLLLALGLRRGTPADLVIFAAAAVVYALALLAFRVITPAELRALAGLWRRKAGSVGAPPA